MKLIALGISHENHAPLELLEKVTFTPSVLPAGLERIQKELHFLEAVILSTCQRTEVFGLVSDGAISGIDEELARFLVSFHGIDAVQILSHIQRYESQQVPEHLFRVVSGLDSIALGENQILGQVREAYGAALGANTTGKITSKLFEMAVSVGKRIRTETEIGRRPVSISSLAVDLADQVLNGLVGKEALIIGSGEMSELAATLLRKRGIKKLNLINRTHGRAQELALRLGGEACHWDSLAEVMSQADVVISSTAAPHAVVSFDLMREVMAKRERPLMLVDIAMPRDIEPEVASIPGIHLYNLDDLTAVVDKNLKEREKEIPKATKIIEVEVIKFMSWLASLETLPTLTALRTLAEDVRQSEVERALQKLDGLTDRERDVVEQLSRRIVTKLLHLPTVRLKENQNDDRSLEQAAKKLFGLEEKR